MIMGVMATGAIGKAGNRCARMGQPVHSVTREQGCGDGR